MEILRRAWSKYYEDGFVSTFKVANRLLFSKLLNLTRVITPVERYALWNGVKVPPKVAPKYGLIDRYFEMISTDYSESEGGEVKSHKEFTKPGDTVVIIGGGRGVTTVHAVWESNPDGHVKVFEASKYCSDIVKEVVDINNVKNSCEINNALVGSNIKVYGSEKYNRSIHPSELPKCDVLEMDCEGAELDIIRNIDIYPRVIIMEVHPNRYQESTQAVDELDSMGYDIVSFKKNKGGDLSEIQFDEILDECSRGEAPAPVVVGVKSS